MAAAINRSRVWALRGLTANASGTKAYAGGVHNFSAGVVLAILNPDLTPPPKFRPLDTAPQHSCSVGATLDLLGEPGKPKLTVIFGPGPAGKNASKPDLDRISRTFCPEGCKITGTESVQLW